MDQWGQDFQVIKKKLQLYGCHQLTVQFFQMFWRWPCFAVQPFSQSTSRATSSFGFAWLGRSGWRTQTTQDLWPCHLELVILCCEIWGTCKDFAAMLTVLAFCWALLPRPVAHLGHGIPTRKIYSAYDINDPVQYLSKQLAESTSHPDTQTNVLQHYWGTTVRANKTKLQGHLPTLGAQLRALPSGTPSWVSGFCFWHSCFNQIPTNVGHLKG